MIVNLIDNVIKQFKGILISKMIKIYYMSDVHLEFNHSLPHKVDVDDAASSFLVVAGDTIPTRYLQQHVNDANGRSMKKAMIKFLKQISAFKQVFFVMGNHEHYNGDIQLSKQILQDFISDNQHRNMVVLEDDVVCLTDDIDLIGCTLWTNMNKDDPISHIRVKQGMNDFRMIDNGKSQNGITSNLFTTHDAVNIHNESFKYINDHINNNPNKKFVIVTHHAPSLQSNGEEHAGSTIIDGYCSDLESFIIDNPSILTWIHGHTHVNVDYLVGSTRIVANCIGYGLAMICDSSFKEFKKNGLRYIEI